MAEDNDAKKTEPEARAKAVAKARGSASDDTYAKAKRHFLVACAAIAGGLGIAGSLDRSTGGVILLIGWIMAVWSLHRLGRAGSDRRREGTKAS